MARARNIKPSFFTNDELSELEPLARILFIGMWTIADFKGCFEYKPKRLKVQILPYDDCNIEQLVSSLDKSGFISIYSVQGQRYIKVINFGKHQNPHKNEREGGSSIPDISMSDEKKPENSDHLQNIEINHDQNGTDRADSLNLIPDSLNLIPEGSSSDVVENVPPPQPKFVFKTELKKAGVTEEAAAEFMQVRKAKKAVNTKNAFEKLVEESQKANLSLPQAIDFCLKRQKPWGAFMATWYQNEQQQVQQAYHSQSQTNPWAEYNQRVGEQFSQNEMVDVTPKKSVLIEEVGHA
ncbi:hypothetical protein [Acinetobacter sp. ANC 5045]|uniref:hypothetical protein n=1 Tax=Acinetobacter sp. ANC 5045 TaxID=2529851 RepID=UPI00103B250E|nr:hypothetical protein [Acinetobacter sp. ANC 5045]TCB16097.1 hypothetical protein E0H79_10205 [Acinetobacter sp. ANC 5045]